MSQDFKSTVFLPKTDFPMRAALPEREPVILERWAGTDLWGQLRARSKGRTKYVLHDGPPYANGNIHMGTALNKILKDIVSRSRQMLGYDSVYVPGWDCHGLPIEWQIEQQYRKRGANKDEVPIIQFRQECRQHAERFIDVQRAEFQRLGCLGDWYHPYTTMAPESEARIFQELAKFLMDGSLYRGLRAVMWSTVEKTALADAVAVQPRLRLRGLMAIPAPFPDEAPRRAAFRRMRALFDALATRHPGIDTLSMGMSGDYEAAIGCGATHVRVGTALFGDRNRP